MFGKMAFAGSTNSEQRTFQELSFGGAPRSTVRLSVLYLLANSSVLI
jgi:hypothetical protein